MTKTLADMTAEEREECVGMWAEFRSTRGIILGYEAGYVRLLSPNRVGGDREVISHTHIGLTHLLPDLPRAWTPDGKPVDGKWEEGNVFVCFDCEPGEYPVSIEGLTEGGMSYFSEPPSGIEVDIDKYGEGTGEARRWVNDWEQS
ncbi:hypothetical protein [Corynebacterium stationis]|uniref:hypothetical protein n=1 Tax=Corynebacterium stationis TaxID=1705 RepID=UPI0028A74BB4|nr:hypothetical protein [Corynebacterium stationis]